jgi:hypothetical protein
LKTTGTRKFGTYLTQLSGKSHRADAPESVDLIHTLPSVDARATLTVIYIRLTRPSRIARQTRTVEIVDEVDASRTMPTLPDTIVDVDVTVVAGPARGAVAPIVAHEVGAAQRGVHTGGLLTLVCVWKGQRKRNVIYVFYRNKDINGYERVNKK